MTAQAPAALTVPLAEAARLLGMSESNARLLERQGKFPVRVQRVGSWLRVSRADIDAYLHVAPPPLPPAPDFGAVLIRARLAAIEAERAVLASYLGADDAGLFSRTAASDRTYAPTGERATYPVAAPGRGTLDHTGPATVAGEHLTRKASIGHEVELVGAKREECEDGDGPPSRLRSPARVPRARESGERGGDLPVARRPLPAPGRHHDGPRLLPGREGALEGRADDAR